MLTHLLHDAVAGPGPYTSAVFYPQALRDSNILFLWKDNAGSSTTIDVDVEGSPDGTTWHVLDNSVLGDRSATNTYYIEVPAFPQMRVTLNDITGATAFSVWAIE